MKYNHRIAIIGAGQLGTRHLQGLVRLSMPCEIHVVDPSVKSLDLARQRVDDVVAAATHALKYHHHIESLPQNLDYVVVATTADIRLNVMHALFHRRTVKNILLEKVLFQRVSDYAAADKLLRQANCRAWVSCLRRAAPIYDTLRTFFLEDQLQHVDVRGGNWGLGCNSIHFLDITAYIAGGEPHSISTALLDESIIESKRAGFIEFTGTLLGRCGDASFSLTAERGSQAPVLMTLRGANRSCIVDESRGIAFLCDPNGSGWHTVNFKTPVLSELITGVTQRILEYGSCELTPYSQSAAYHLPLLQSLGSHAVHHLDELKDCLPIT